MQMVYRQFTIRDWQPGDREAVAQLLSAVLAEFGLSFDPDGADRDAVQVEAAYQSAGGAFWVVEQAGRVVGSGGYYPCDRGDQAVELRKMYLRPEVRGQGLGRFLLGALEQAAQQQGFTEMWLETANSLKGAIALYEKSGYSPGTGVETPRCDRVYVKRL